MTPVHTGDGGERLAPVTYLPSAVGHSADWAVPGVTAAGAEGSTGDATGDASAVEASAVSPRQAKRASNVSIAGLSRRNMSRWEIDKLLRSRELDEETIASELSRLEGLGLIDDSAFAEHLVRTQHERKGLGRQAITSELRRRHIDPQIIDEALESLDDDDERSRAFALAEKRAGQLSSHDHETAKRRLTGFLQRKGYNSGLVREAVGHALGSPRSPRSTVRFQ